MKHTIRTVGAFLALAITASSPAAANQTVLLAWMEGCWISEDGSTREIWTRNTDGLLFGSSTVSHNGKAVFFEQLRIEIDGGRATLHAYPGGIGPASFDFAGYDHDHWGVTFTNLDHDYPQRIKYWKDGDRLLAEISLADGKNPRNWSYLPCPAAD